MTDDQMLFEQGDDKAATVTINGPQAGYNRPRRGKEARRARPPSVHLGRE